MERRRDEREKEREVEGIILYLWKTQRERENITPRSTMIRRSFPLLAIALIKSPILKRPLWHCDMEVQS